MCCLFEENSSEGKFGPLLECIVNSFGYHHKAISGE